MTASIIALQCPVCGAPYQPDSDRCGYCGSILALKAHHPRIDPKLLNKSVIDQHIAEYRRTLRTDPNDETAHYGLGVAYFNLGLSEDSIRQLTRAAELMPENPNIQTQLAVALREATREGSTEATQQMHRRIEIALRLDADHLEAILLQAEVAREAGALPVAAKRFKRAHEIAPDQVRQPYIDILVDLSRKQQRDEAWDGLVETWGALGLLDRDKVKREVSYFLQENKKLIPRGYLRSASHRISLVKSRPMVRTSLTVAQKIGWAVMAFVGTVIVGAFISVVLAAILEAIVGEDSPLSAVIFVLWLISLVAVPIVVVRKKSARMANTALDEASLGSRHHGSASTSYRFDRDALVRGTAELDTMSAAAEAVIEARQKAASRSSATSRSSRR